MQVNRYLCKDCEQSLRQSNLIYRKMPNSEGSYDRCQWCHRRCYGAAFVIRYAEKKEQTYQKKTKPEPSGADPVSRGDAAK